MAKELRVLVVKDGDTFVAQCLEVDIAAQGTSEADAMNKLRTAFRCESELAESQGKSVFDLGPAPQHFHTFFGADIVSRDTVTMMAA